jgi:hypothetical protein
LGLCGFCFQHSWGVCSSHFPHSLGTSLQFLLVFFPGCLLAC